MFAAIKNRWHSPGGYREVLVLALPLIASTGSWSLFLFTSRMFLSWHSPEALAASVPAGIMEWVVVSLFQGTASYAGIFVAQYYGAKQQHRIGAAVWQGLYIALIGGVLIMALYPVAPWLFRLIGHDSAVQVLEAQYFQVLCLAGIPSIANGVLSSFYSGLGRTLPVMLVSLAGTLVNFIFCYLLIFGRFGFPEMGIRGAGWAAVLGALCSFVLYILLIFNSRHEKEFGIVSGWRFDKTLFARLVRFGFPSGMHLIVDAAGFTLFILFVGRLGMVPLAATNIAFNINTLAFMPMLGLGIAVSVLVGQYLGQNQSALAARSVHSTFHMVFIYMTLIAASYILIPDVFIYPYAAKSDPALFPAIRELAVTLLVFVAFFSIFDACNIVFASAIKGAGDTRFVMQLLVVLTLFVFVVPTYLVLFVFKKGIFVAWAILTLYVLLLAGGFTLRFFGGKWKSMRVIEESLPVIPQGLPEIPDSRL